MEIVGQTGISHYSVDAWKSLLISTVVREHYEQNHDLDMRVLFFKKGLSKHTAAAALGRVHSVGQQVISSTNRRLKAKFSLPTRKFLKAHQEDGSDEWFKNHFKQVLLEHRVLKVGLPSLQKSRPGLPRFKRIWKMLNSAQKSVTEKTSDTKRRRKRNLTAKFIFAPVSKSEPQFIRLVQDQDERQLILPALVLSLVERNGRFCVLVTGTVYRRYRQMQRMLMVIDEQGYAYDTLALDRIQFTADMPRKNWKYGKGDILKILELIEAGPKSALGFLGKLAGTCGCCGLTLKAKKSLEMGVGPVCAKRFKLGQFSNSIQGYNIGDDPVIHLAPRIVEEDPSDGEIESSSDEPWSDEDEDDEMSPIFAQLGDDQDEEEEELDE